MPTLEVRARFYERTDEEPGRYGEAGIYVVEHTNLVPIGARLAGVYMTPRGALVSNGNVTSLQFPMGAGKVRLLIDAYQMAARIAELWDTWGTIDNLISYKPME
jgi:hypothetical protein